MATAWLIQTNSGYRLFDTKEEAAAYDGQPWEGGGYLAPQPVCKEDHYRGKIGPEGVLFTDEDQSTLEFAALLANL
jgi:hypothetical protein